MHTGRMSCEHEGRGHGEVSINPGILKSARGKAGDETDSPSQPLEGTSPAGVACPWTSRLQNYEIINLCC